MKSIFIEMPAFTPIPMEDIRSGIDESLKSFPDLKRVLIIPPDLTRPHAYAGPLTNLYYHALKDRSHVDILPALGTHDPMTREEFANMFGTDIPFDRMIVHNWREDVKSIGLVPESFIREVSGGLMEDGIDIRINKHILEGSYDLILSIGQVVPHEVAGMANYSKNILVGCAGADVINKTHMLGAVCGMEDAMGKDFSPVRKVLDYAQNHFLKDLPLIYVLTVTTTDESATYPHGIYIGKDRDIFERAVVLSKELNFTSLDQPLDKVLVYLDPGEFRSTWLGNKAIYRTRMAMADKGQLIILGPGVTKFGEDPIIDKLIRKYGYVGAKKVNELTRANEDLQKNLSAAAHLIHGSSEGRFEIVYAVEHMSRDEIGGVGFTYMPLDEALAKYKPASLKDGFNILENGESIYYISNPALGLWTHRQNQSKSFDS